MLPVGNVRERNADGESMVSPVYAKPSTEAFYPNLTLSTNEVFYGSDLTVRTTCRTDKVTFTWAIEAFSSYCHFNRDDKEYPVEDLNIISPPFGPKTNEQFQFYLEVLPRNIDRGKYCVGLYLRVHKDSAIKGKCVRLHICLLDANECERESFTDSVQNFDGWGCSEFIEYEHLLNLEKGYLVNDTLTIRAKITCLTDQINVCRTPQTTIEEAHKKAEDEVLEDLAKLIFCPEYAKYAPGDVIVAVGTHAVTFLLHKAILVTRSPVFCAMFANDLVENRQNYVQITDCTAQVFNILIQFIYTGKLFQTDAISVDLLIAADKYQLEKLKTICALYLSKALSIDTVVTLLQWSDRHSSEHLKSECILYITEHCAQVMQTPAWATLATEQPQLVTTIFQEYIAKTDSSIYHED